MISTPGQEVSTGTTFLRLKLRHLALTTVLLPFVGFVFSVFGATYWNYKRSTSTHCDVENFAPSISSAIGTEPQKFVWQFCIGLHIAPRFFFSLLNAKYLSDHLSVKKSKDMLVRSCLILQWIENVALLTLTIVSSEENFTVHKFAFVSFGLTALSYMAINVYLISYNGYRTSNHRQRQAVQLKKQLFRLTFVCCFLASYFYWRHNTYCEKYVYSFFCLFEYAIVLTNMSFHMTSYLDFYDSEVLVSRPSVTYLPLINRET